MPDGQSDKVRPNGSYVLIIVVSMGGGIGQVSKREAGRIPLSHSAGLVSTSCSALPKARFSRFRRNPAWTFSLRLRIQPPDLVAPPRARSGEIHRVSRETRTGDARRRRGRRVRGTRHACLRLFTHTTLEAWSSRGCPEAHRSSRTHWVGFYSLFT